MVERVLEQVARQCSDLVIVTDERGVIVYTNPRFTDATGFGRQELEGRAVSALRGVEQAAAFDGAWEAARSGHVWSGDLELVGKDGRAIALTATVTPVVEGGQARRIVATAQTLTDRVLVRRRLERAEQMETVGTLAAGLAHDFNNALAAILMTAVSVQEDLAEGRPPTAISADVTEIVHAADHATHLVRQLLALARGDSSKPCRVDLGTYLLDLALLLRRAVGAGIELEVLPAHGAAVVCVDPQRLEQVLLNLCMNARDAMGGRGRLELAVTTERRGSRWWGVVRVTDEGPGIPEGVRERIFEPFFTTKAGYGTGLGLTTSDAIVRAAGGVIELETTPGRGSTFRVALPMIEPLPRPNERTPPPPSGKTVLVVDDSDALRAIVARVLGMAGYRVLEAPDGAAAVEWLRATRVDMVLTDVAMPVMDGAALRRWLEEHQPTTPLVVMSGQAPPESMLGERYLAKPFGPGPLLRCVRDMIGAPAHAS